MGAHRGRLEQRLWPHFLLAAEQARRKSAGWREGPCPHPWAPDLGLAYLHYGSSRAGHRAPAPCFCVVGGRLPQARWGCWLTTRSNSLGLGLYQGPLTSSCLLSEKRPDRLTHVCLSQPGVGNPASGWASSRFFGTSLRGPQMLGPVVQNPSLWPWSLMCREEKGNGWIGRPFRPGVDALSACSAGQGAFAHSVGHLHRPEGSRAGCSRRDESPGEPPKASQLRKMVVLCCGWRGVSFRLSGISLCELRKCCVLSGWGTGGRILHQAWIFLCTSSPSQLFFLHPQVS